MHLLGANTEREGVTLSCFMKSCIFVDGENFRHSLNDLFGRNPNIKDFKKEDYLPRADWSKFYNAISLSLETTLLRTYWYVTEHIDFRPYIEKLPNKTSPKYEKKLTDARAALKRVYKTSKIDEEKPNIQNEKPDEEETIETINTLKSREQKMKSRFDGWRKIQTQIARDNDRIEFVSSGSIPFNLLQENFGTEKGVDTRLTTDMITMAPNYDMAIIISGDADYIPPIKAIKRMGKIVANVSFLTKNNKTLPGRAFRLETTVDHVHKIKYDDMAEYMSINQ